MAVDAAVIQYKDEFVKAFEQRQSLLRQATTTEVVVKGNQATFLVAGSGTDEAVTRGSNGLIPAQSDTESQLTATLVEWHSLRRKTKFNVFASQGNQRRIMQLNTVSVINRKIDQDLIVQLTATSVNTGAAVTADMALVMLAKAKLGNAGVPSDSNLYAVVTPAFEAYLMRTKEFASAEYINNKPTQEADLAWKDIPVSFRWVGVNWCTHPNLPGKATAAEECYMWHKSAIGHALDSESLDIDGDYDREQSYFWDRASAFMGSKLLQTTGIVQINHDGSAFA